MVVKLFLGWMVIFILGLVMVARLEIFMIMGRIYLFGWELFFGLMWFILRDS